LHRAAQVKPGARALSIGASGGVGLALLQLGILAGLTLYGTASQSKHRLLTEQGAIPIDYHTQDFVQVIRQAEPNGLDFVFDGVGGANVERGLAVLRRGGQLVTYSAPTSNGSLLRGIGSLLMSRLRAQPVKIFGVTALYTTDKRPFMEDWAVLCKLLAEGKIKPIIAAKFPILEAAKANELFESGKVAGNVVLLASELL
jgi:NADPH:quinone reductase-like Zn-dependent oxidoreductase